MAQTGRTVKNICDAVLQETGLITGLQYATATDDTERRVFAMLNRALIDLGRFDWPALTTEATIALTTATSYDLASDFARFTRDSIWEQAGEREVQLPVGQRQWRLMEATGDNTGITLRGKMIGTQLHLTRSENGETLSYEYISSNLAKNAAGTAKRRFTADTDTSRIDDELLILNTQFRFMRAMGLETWATIRKEYLRHLSHELGNMQGRRTVRTLDEPGFSLDAHFNDWVSP